MKRVDERAAGELLVSALGLALLTRRVSRRQTDEFDRQWAARAGTGQGGGDLVSWLAQPRNGFFETIAIAAWPRLAGRERLAILGAPLMAGLVGHVLKLLVPRDRPGKARFSPQGDQSFPSTHAAHAASLAFATAYAARDRGAGNWTLAAAAFVATAIAYARVRACAHWPTDALAGALAGLASAQVARLGARLRPA